MAPQATHEAVAVFSAPGGKLQVTEPNGEALPDDVWLTQMHTSVDLEAMHLPPDPDDPTAYFKIVATRPTETRKLLQEEQILR